MSNLRPFQIVTLALFAALAVGGLVLLGAYQAQRSEESQLYGDRVVVWGTFDQIAFEAHFQDIQSEIEAFGVVEYVEVDEREFIPTLVDAIAESRSPDLVVIPTAELVSLRTKLIPISYETLDQRTLRDTYIDAFESFMFPEGTYALPFAADPLVLYWNRDLFASNGIATAPASWEMVVSQVVPQITQADKARRSVTQSAVALGEYRNLTHPKDVLLMLLLQSGSRMTTVNEGVYTTALNQSVQSVGRPPFVAALEFFTEFSNVNSPLYTWNRAMTNDQEAFLAGDVAMYFGRGSDYNTIRSRNPNLNFDVAVVPQGQSATIKRTSGELYGFAIPRLAANPQGAFAAAKTLAEAPYADALAARLALVSPRRDTIARGEADPFRQSLLTSALYMRTWLDPEPVTTETVFQTMVEDVVSNRARVSEAVVDAERRITNLY